MDGWLIQGVITTRIYCRPSCPARPKPENVRIFESTAAARSAGMRACKRCKPDEAEVGIVRHLPYQAPLDVDALLGFFGRRAIPGVEEFDGSVYRRSLRLKRGFGVVEMRALGERFVRMRRGDGDAGPEGGAIAVRLHLDDVRDETEAVARVRAMLDLDADPAAIADALGQERLMKRLVAADPGRRVPGCASGDEIAVRAVLGQQVSLAGAATLAGRIVTEYGEPLRNPLGSVTRAFPASEVLANAVANNPNPRAPSQKAQSVFAPSQKAQSDFAGWSMPASRVRALGALTRALADGKIVLAPGADRRATEDRLLALPGIGPWTASYIAMRALRDSDAFLASDLGVRHALDRLGLDSRPAAAEALSQSWRPYRAYALQHLWAVAS